MKKLSKTQKKVLVIMTATVLASLAVFLWLSYSNDYYKASDKAKKAMFGSEAVKVSEENNYYLFSPKEGSSKGIVFYPGGKVEETAYAPLLLKLAESGYEVYLVKMPAKLAVFGINRAEDILEEASHIEEWTMMGHSLGGAMAAVFSASHDTQVDALLLLAAYSTENLRDKEIEVYSIYGSEDQVLDMEKYEKYQKNLPENTKELLIDGGNHANYGYYGEQEGDGQASITREEQQECVLDFFLLEKRAD